MKIALTPRRKKPCVYCGRPIRRAAGFVAGDRQQPLCSRCVKPE